MQTYVDLSGSTLLYALVIAGLVFVAVLCVIFYRKTYKRALELGITKDTLSRINKNTISLTIVPSISIVIGLFTLSTVLVPSFGCRLRYLRAYGCTDGHSLFGI